MTEQSDSYMQDQVSLTYYIHCQCIILLLNFSTNLWNDHVNMLKYNVNVHQFQKFNW